jgi:hypothetical protein
MHRPQAVGLGAVILGLMVAILAPAVAEARRPTGHGLVVTPLRQITSDAYVLARTAKQAVRAGTTDEACTGWRSTVVPPPSIRVLRTVSDVPGVNGTVETVPFRQYVETVIPAEWPPFYPMEVLKAGAITVKQFAWYYTIVYRGGVNGAGECYDVRDDTIDQWYEPETRKVAKPHLKAFDATWGIHLRKYERETGRGRFILTGYRAGANVPCGSDSDRWRIYQHSAYLCGKEGLNMEQVLRTYLDPRLEIVTPGLRDIVGDGSGRVDAEAGDAGAVVASQGQLVPHIWEVSRDDITPATAAAIDLAAPDLLGWASADANRDGWDDLVVARRTGELSVALSVARSDGTGYIAERAWYSGPLEIDPADARVLAGDFTGDLAPDAALLIPRPAEAWTLLVFPRAKGAGFQAPIVWWTGAMPPGMRGAWSGDVSGDGRDDLIVANDLGDGGREYLAALSRGPAPGLGDLRQRHLASDLVGDIVLETVGDLTRDGRDEIVLVIDTGERTRIELLRPLKHATAPYLREVAWTGDRLPLDQVRLSTSDVDYDGITDLVVFRDRGGTAIEVQTFVTPPNGRYGTMAPGPSIVDESVGWGTVRPYSSRATRR